VSPYFAYAFDEYYKTIRLTNQLNASYILSRDYFLNGTIAHTNYHRTKNTYRKDLVSLNEVLVQGAEQQDTTTLNSWMVRSTFSRDNRDANFNYQLGVDFNIDQADGTRFADEIKNAGDYAFFASAEYKANKRLEVKPAVRISYNTDYKAPVVPSVMLKYDFTKSLQGRLSYGKGFRAPGINERYLYFVDINHNIRGNENLLPEYSDNFFLNLNKRMEAGKVVNTIELSGFYNDIRNMITLAQPDITSSLYTYINLGKFSTHGGSLSNTFTFNNVSLGVGVSFSGRYYIYADRGDFL
jgi:outer membrane receptor for ferrienterochelin and colicins